jgi:signal peptidase I
MSPTFAAGDRVVVNRLAYRLRWPVKGELVALRHPMDEDLPLLKRVAGVPGDVIADGTEEYALGPDEWFVVGDNRDASSDSRSFGPIPSERIIGKVWFRY